MKNTLEQRAPILTEVRRNFSMGINLRPADHILVDNTIILSCVGDQMSKYKLKITREKILGVLFKDDTEFEQRYQPLSEDEYEIKKGTPGSLVFTVNNNTIGRSLYIGPNYQIDFLASSGSDIRTMYTTLRASRPIRVDVLPEDINPEEYLKALWLEKQRS